MSNALITWFGDDFHDLHPNLQALHMNSGTLSGMVTITTGRSFFSRLLGKKLAKKIGVPTDKKSRQLTVSIAHEADGMHWGRNFSDGIMMTSIFKAIGSKATDGYIIESTGLLKAKLTVDIIKGGWYWRPLKMLLGTIPLPIWLFPKSNAYKRVNEQGKYEFSVSFTMPLLGNILSYSGQLTPEIGN